MTTKSPIQTSRLLRNPMIMGLLITLFLAIGSYWIYMQFYRTPDACIIDNPGTTTLKIELNNQSYTLLDGNSIQFQSKIGDELKLKIPELKIDTTLHQRAHQILLNPTASAYVLYERVYGYSEKEDSIFEANTFVLDGEKYFGKGLLDSSFVISGFDYNLHQKLPEVVRRGQQDSLKTYTKIFRKREFKQFYFEHYQ